MIDDGISDNQRSSLRHPLNLRRDYLGQAQFSSRQYQRRPPLAMDNMLISAPKPQTPYHLRHGFDGRHQPYHSQTNGIFFEHPQDVDRPMARGTQTQAEHLKSQQTRQPLASRLRLVLVGMAFLVFGLGVLTTVQTLQTNQNAKSQVDALSQQNDSNNVPSEQKPSSGTINNYQVAPGLPKFIKIAKLGIDARILQTSVTETGELGSPSNIYDTDWYSGSARPGDPASQGAVLIDGHVHGPTLPGVFADIKNLQLNDMVQIVRGDNQIFNYRVIEVQNYQANTMDMGAALKSIKPGTAGLNLITCGGLYSSKNHEYLQRTVVYAAQQ